MTEENEELSLREQLEAAVVEHTEEPVKIEPTVAENASVQTEEKPKAEGRDEKGQFTTKPAKETKAEAAPVTTAKKPPEFWPQARKDKFGTLPPDVQDLMLEREAEVEKGFTKMDDERTFGKQLKEVVAPYMATIQAEGGTAAGAVKDLLNTAYILRSGSPQQKAAIVQQVIKQYGVDTRLFGAQASGQTQQPSINKDEIVREAITAFQTQQMNDTIASELKAFTADTKNVHFAAVKDNMSALLGAGIAKNYQDAYDQAVKLAGLSPVVNAEPQRQQPSVDVAAKKRAGSSVSGSPGITIPNSGNPNRSLREELDANWGAIAH